MNILYVLNTTIPTNGATKSFMLMLQQLMQQGVTPTVILPNRDGIFLELQRMGVHVLITNYRDATYSYLNTRMDYLKFIPRTIARIILNRRAVRYLTESVKNTNPTIIHSNVSVLGIGFSLSRRLNVPHIYHIREFADLDFNMHYFPSKASFLRRLNAPLSYSISITKVVEQYHHQNGRPTSRVIYNGISYRQHEMPHLPKQPFFLFAGRIEPAKGLDHLLAAYARYVHLSPQTIMPLKVAGRVHDKIFSKNIDQFIQQQSIHSWVKFVGEQSNLSSLMQQATAIIVPSPNEAFGRVLAEAMFNGCLCIALNTAGTREQMDNGKQTQGDEIALRYDTEDDLIRLLIEVSSHKPDHYNAYRQRAFKTVNQLYTIEQNAKNVLMFYQSISQQCSLLSSPQKGVDN